MSVKNVAKTARTARTVVGCLFDKQSAARAHAWMKSQPEARQTRILASTLAVVWGAAAAAHVYGVMHGKQHGFILPLAGVEAIAAGVFGLVAVRPDLKKRVIKETFTAAYVAYRFAGTALRFVGLVAKTAFRTAAVAVGGALTCGAGAGAVALAYEATQTSGGWQAASVVAAAAMGIVACKFGAEAERAYKGYPEWGTFKGDVKNFWNKTKTIAAGVRKVRATCDRPSQAASTQAPNSEVLMP